MPFPAALLWRGSLLPLEGEALPGFLGAASQPSASKLPRHSRPAATRDWVESVIAQCPGQHRYARRAKR
ncbi:hypothetical protein C7A10_12000 [Pseudomonas fluorescens]|uniref:Uncharacterized protein n=1 Tax=Pseudomonas fluorescens TaxID=294 RepID=A0A2T0ID51_PSEFL|nr:hypothetical protein C7A10_12000 [Pseudomonas fluorescens]